MSFGMSFDSLGLSEELLNAVKAKGYDTPSPIQKEGIPAVLTGKDVMAAAQTGTGKTAAFTLPLLQMLAKGRKARPNRIRALILTPTRELAAQVEESVVTYGKTLPMTSTVVFGGVGINPQMKRLSRGVDILVATPGRLLDLYSQNAVRFDDLEYFILDEADRMLDMGFIHDIRRLMRFLPRIRQNLLFSATFSEEIRDLAKGIVNSPIEISVAQRNTTAETVEQIVYPCDKNQKMRLVTNLIKDNRWKQVLIFTKTKHGANKLTKHLIAKKISSAAIHGNKSQAARTKALAGFKSNEIRVLVATDIAARGLDIEQLPHVINFELPHVPEDYVHRIGRTGRAGSTGEAYSLVCSDEFKLLRDIEQVIQKHLEREYVQGFEPVNNLPPSPPIRPRKKARPKKVKPHFEHHDGQHRRGGSKGNRPSSDGRRSSSDGRRSAPKSGANSKSKRVSSGSSKEGTAYKPKRFSAGSSKEGVLSNNTPRRSGGGSQGGKIQGKTHRKQTTSRTGVAGGSQGGFGKPQRSKPNSKPGSNR